MHNEREVKKGREEEGVKLEETEGRGKGERKEAD